MERLDSYKRIKQGAFQKLGISSVTLSTNMAYCGRLVCLSCGDIMHSIPRRCVSFELHEAAVLALGGFRSDSCLTAIEIHCPNCGALLLSLPLTNYQY